MKVDSYDSLPLEKAIVLCDVIILAVCNIGVLGHFCPLGYI